MDEKVAEIVLGEAVCAKLKRLHYPDVEWIDCYKDIGKKFSLIKKAAIKFYVDKSIEEVLSALGKYSESDLNELYST